MKNIFFFLDLFQFIVFDSSQQTTNSGLSSALSSTYWSVFFAQRAEIFFLFFVFSFIFISWKLITLQYCSGFCHTLTWISHGFTCIPHPDPPSHLPLYPIPLDMQNLKQKNLHLDFSDQTRK